MFSSYKLRCHLFYAIIVQWTFGKKLVHQNRPHCLWMVFYVRRKPMNRRDQREQAFILIFERTVNQNTIAEIIQNAGECREWMLSDFAEKIATGAQEKEAIIDEKIEQNIHTWKMNRLSRVSFALLRLAIHEMMFETEIPISVSINEAVNLAKKYGNSEDAPFINGVLGSVAKELNF